MITSFKAFNRKKGSAHHEEKMGMDEEKLNKSKRKTRVEIANHQLTMEL